MPAFLLALAFFAGTPAAAQQFSFPPDSQAIQAALSESPAPPAVLPAADPLALEPAAIWDDPPIPGLDSPGAVGYQAEAERLAARGLGFSAVFAGLCRRLLDEDLRAARDPRAALADLYRGLIRWTRRGGKPAFQGREDWPLHFIYGGYLAAAYGRTAAETAAFAKENRDAVMPGNAFDLDDLAVTLLGARWAASAGDGNLSVWAEPWASERKNLDALPALRFGRLPHARLPSPSRVAEVRAFVRGAL